jgi:nucleoside-diphosphate-sugar epimerase
MGPVNIGSEEMVTINQLVEYACDVRNKTLVKSYDTTKPQGVRGRNSHNRLIEEKLGWKPKYSLKDGITWTYNWIEEQVANDQTNS